MIFFCAYWTPFSPIPPITRPWYYQREWIIIERQIGLTEFKWPQLWRDGEPLNNFIIKIFYYWILTVLKETGCSLNIKLLLFLDKDIESYNQRFRSASYWCGSRSGSGSASGMMDPDPTWNWTNSNFFLLNFFCIRFKTYNNVFLLL